MYARVVTYWLQAGKLDERPAIVRDSVVQLRKERAGFKRFVVLVDRER
jgi:hypothetical protein